MVSPRAPSRPVPATSAVPPSATRRSSPSRLGRAVSAPSESEAVAQAQKISVDRVGTSLCAEKPKTGSASRTATISGADHHGACRPSRRPRRSASATAEQHEDQRQQEGDDGDEGPGREHGPRDGGVVGWRVRRRLRLGVQHRHHDGERHLQVPHQRRDQQNPAVGTFLMHARSPSRRDGRTRHRRMASGSIVPAGLNVFNSFFAPARPGRDRPAPRGGSRVQAPTARC